MYCYGKMAGTMGAGRGSMVWQALGCTHQDRQTAAYSTAKETRGKHTRRICGAELAEARGVKASVRVRLVGCNGSLRRRLLLLPAKRPGWGLPTLGAAPSAKSRRRRGPVGARAHRRREFTRPIARRYNNTSVAK